MTDTTGMKGSFITACAFAVVVLVILMAAPLPAGAPRRTHPSRAAGLLLGEPGEVVAPQPT